MKETELYAKLRPYLLLWGECDRVENTLGSGMADVFYNIGGKTGWIETKLMKDGILYFEKFQPNWLAKHHRQGARLFVVAMDENQTMFFYPAGVILAARRTPYKKWITVDTREMPTVFFMRHPYKSWNSVKELLIS